MDTLISVQLPVTDAVFSRKVSGWPVSGIHKVYPDKHSEELLAIETHLENDLNHLLANEKIAGLEALEKYASSSSDETELSGIAKLTTVWKKQQALIAS